jgi:hypothetical protein
MLCLRRGRPPLYYRTGQQTEQPKNGAVLRCHCRPFRVSDYLADRAAVLALAQVVLQSQVGLLSLPLDVLAQRLPRSELLQGFTLLPRALPCVFRLTTAAPHP